jgi:hypothetical protein
LAGLANQLCFGFKPKVIVITNATKPANKNNGGVIASNTGLSHIFVVVFIFKAPFLLLKIIA